MKKLNIPDLCYERRKSVPLTKDEYNYLLPVLRKYLLKRTGINELNGGSTYHFIGYKEQIEDMRRRLEGLYW